MMSSAARRMAFRGVRDVQANSHVESGPRQGAVGHRGEAQQAVGFTDLGFSQFGGVHRRARRHAV
jgi:hypothetical protein